MKNILVLGAGMVTRPLVQYLLEQNNLKVTVASRTVAKAEKLIGDHPRGRAEQLLIDDHNALSRLISECDVAVSMVPYAHHVDVAKLCIEHGKHMVTTSYVSAEMKELDSAAASAGVLILNETGLDPGIDHMSAMRVIHKVKEGGGRISRFHSYCGGLPAPEANTNPWKYKFSWSPRGVVLAARNAARFLENGREISIPGEKLFTRHWPVYVEGVGELESYVNRDSIPYMKLYGIEDVDSICRGTLRHKGWSDTWRMISELGLLDLEERHLDGMTYAGLMGSLLGVDGSDVKSAIAKRFGIAEDADPIRRLEWLGLFEDEPVPAERSSNLDILTDKLREKCMYSEGERDMVVLYHEFTAEYPDRKEEITSTLVDYGMPNGDSSMSRTVGLPAAIAAHLIIDGKIKGRGVAIPVEPELYNPILDELEGLGISCEEKWG